MPRVLLHHYSQSMPKKLVIGDAIHSGGEGKVHFSNDGKYSAILYHEEKLNKKEKRDFLEFIIKLGENLRKEGTFLLWPLAIVEQVDGQNRFGCVMERLHSPPYCKLNDIMYTAKQAVEQFKQGNDWAKYLQVARGIARSIAVLHSDVGCAHADIQANNFLVDIDKAQVVLIDMDGLVVPSWTPAQVMGTFGFMAPEILLKKSAPNMATDRHSLAVMILYTLLFRNPLEPLRCYDDKNQEKDNELSWGKEICFSEHPSDRRNRPSALGVPLFKKGTLSYKMLSPLLQKLTEKALIDGLHDPDERPHSMEWINALSSSLDELWACQKCKQRVIYPYWLEVSERNCPFCGKHLDDEKPCVIRIYEPGKSGRYLASHRHIVAGNNWSLFPDMLEKGADPTMTRTVKDAIASVQWDSKSNYYRLVNYAGGRWSASIRGRGKLLHANKGESLPLEKGTTIKFGDDLRIAYVVE